MASPQPGNAETAPDPARLLTQTQHWLAEGRKPEVVARDGFPLFGDDPLSASHRLLNGYLEEISPNEDLTEVKVQGLRTGKTLLGQADQARLLTLRAIMVRVWLQNEREAEEQRRLAQEQQGMAYQQRMDHWVNAIMSRSRSEQPMDCVAFATLVHELLKSQLPLTSADTISLVDLVHNVRAESCYYPISSDDVLDLIEQAAAKSPLEPAIVERLRQWRDRIQGGARISPPDRVVLRRLALLLSAEHDPGIIAGEAWSDAALADLKRMSRAACSAWLALLKHCTTASTSKPSQKWLKSACGLVEAVSLDAFKEHVLPWFELVALPRTEHRENADPQWQPDPDLIIGEDNATILKGLAWCCAGRNDSEISRGLSALAEVCFKKVRWLGPRCPRVGNACLYSLSTTSSEDAAAQLSRLDATVKQPTAKKRIGKSLDAAATLTGQTREDLEEKSVPDYGLSIDGKLTQTCGEYSAQLQVVRSRDVAIGWSRAGKSFKATPAEIKRDHAPALKQLQKLGKDITKMLAAQRIRIERLLMTERTWELGPWRQRYLDHPLLAGIARRLIWHFQLGDRTALGIWFNGKLVDVTGRVLDWLAAETRVRLWHPIGFPVETVAAWREWLQVHEVCQPFKQAHREVYLLTDAELRTGTYSNRFAAHILGQHQFAALCTQRGWKYSFMGGFDFQATPTLELAAWNLNAEFWVDPTGELAGSGVALYLATDQVRFVRNNEPVPLAEVPATVFSEVLRDVDLFVGVGSIGSDPAWQDRGEVEGAGAYWQGYSFGDLNASAKTRKEVLERLLPRLKIAERCSLEDKFLVVRGSLRTYRIHLGSGNIQMEPNNQYLCIVPDRAGTGKHGDEFFLPFEGDRTLSIILSKAFLLADDAKIKDQSILTQIKQP